MSLKVSAKFVCSSPTATLTLGDYISLHIGMYLRFCSGNHDHQHAARAMGREQMATSLGTMVTHMQQITNCGWKATSAGTRAMTYSGQSVANGGLTRRVPQLLGTWPTSAHGRDDFAAFMDQPTCNHGSYVSSRPLGVLVILELAFCACGYRLVCFGPSS